MLCHKLVCFPVVLSNKTNMFLLYGIMWKNLASDLFLFSQVNCMKLFLWNDENFFWNLCQEETFHTREKYIFYALTEHKCMVFKTLKDIDEFTELFYSELQKMHNI